MFVWAHDETVEPDKTYRYQARYVLKNPVWGMRNAVGNPALAQQFMLISQASEWSEPVTAPQISRFFVAAGVGPKSQNVKMEVYRWQNGKWNMATFMVAPGDASAGCSTTWTTRPGGCWLT